VERGGRAIRRVCRYVWAAPNTAVGLLGAATVRGRWSLREGVLLVEHARGGLAAALGWRGFTAITLGHVVIVRGRAGEGLLAHELAHVRQAERWGPAYFPAYLLASIAGYRRNPFEKVARRAAEAALGSLKQTLAQAGTVRPGGSSWRGGSHPGGARREGSRGGPSAGAAMTKRETDAAEGGGVGGK
jgi:Domain of unknown function (DUF4157)